MKFVKTLLASFRGKKQKVIEEQVIPDKNVSVQNTSPFIPTTTSKVAVISANDDLLFNEEGFPIIEDEHNNAHFITRRMFTPSMFYKEPSFPPWGEQNRIKQNKNPVNNKDVKLTVENIAETSNIVTVPSPSSAPIENEICIYNGYPIEFKTDEGIKIAINNKGDYNFSTTEQYILQNEMGVPLYKGSVIRVLNCDLHDKDSIIHDQGVLLFV